MSNEKQKYIENRASGYLITERADRLSRKSTASYITTAGNSTVRSKDPPLSIAERFMSISSDTIEKSPILPKVTNYNITISKAMSPEQSSNIPLFVPLNNNLQSKINDNNFDVISLEEEKAIHPLDRNKKIDTTKTKLNNDNKQRRCSTKSEEKLRKEAHIIVCESQETLVVSSTKPTKSDNDSHVKNKNEMKREQVSGIWIGACCFIQTKNSGGAQLPPPGRSCCLGRRACVLFTFFTLLLLVVLGFILFPRTPLIRIEGASETVPAKVTQTKQGEKMGNVAFESQWLLNITIDNRCNYLTTRLNRIKIIVKDNFTGLLIGKGSDNSEENPTPIYLPGRIISTIQLPVSVNYQARDSSDTTFSDLNRACILKNNGTRESLSLHFWFTLYIFGLDWTNYRPTIIASPAIGGFLCPHTTVTQ